MRPEAVAKCSQAPGEGNLDGLYGQEHAVRGEIGERALCGGGARAPDISRFCAILNATGRCWLLECLRASTAGSLPAPAPYFAQAGWSHRPVRA